MRFIVVVLAASVLTSGCGSNSYQIRSGELARLAATPPEARGQHVRVTEQLHDTEMEPAYPVESETQIVIFPMGGVSGPYGRGGYYHDHGPGPGGSFGGVPVGGGGAGGGAGNPGGPPGGTGGKSSGLVGKGGGGKGADAKAEAIVIVVAAVAILVVAAAVEGARFDGYAQLHPMQPVHLFGKDGGYTVLPLAWMDPMTAAWADHAIVRSDEGPWQPLERAALDREGWTYAMFGGLGNTKGADGSKGTGTAATIQLGYFPEQRIGVLGSIFFGWRDDSRKQILFDSRYTAEVDAYPLQAGPVHFGAYGGGGAAYRYEGAGSHGGTALIAGGLLQLDINTRLAITGRVGVTDAHAAWTGDALIGLSVY